MRVLFLLAAIFSTCIAFAQGIITTVAGADPVYRGLPANPLNAPLCSPMSVDTTTSNVFFVYPCLNILAAVNSSTGALSVVAGNGIAGYSGDGGLPQNAQLNRPSVVRVNPVNRTVYIADSGNYRI